MIIEDFLNDGSIIELANGNYLIGYGQRTWLSEPIDTSFYFPDFFLEAKRPWCTHEHVVEIESEELHNLLLEDYYEVSLPEWKLPEPFLFARTFAELQRSFQKGELRKAVPYILVGSQDQMSVGRLRHSLLHAIQATYGAPTRLYGYWQKGSGILGLTPEPLMNLNGQTLTTVACAGTCAPHVAIENFMSDPKERYEHELVIEGIVGALEPFGKVQIGGRCAVDFKLLRHMITPITLELNDEADVMSLIYALHPTPALGAYPRDTGMRWLKHYQSLVPRKHFGAPVGYTRNNVTECVIAIRNVQWNSSSMAIAAGCGIVPQSQCEQEWKEVLLKAQTVQQTLGLTTKNLPIMFSKAPSTVA